jgi:hypothetical protein
MAKIPNEAIGWIVGLVVLLIVLVYKPDWRAKILAIIGSAMVTYSVTNSIQLSLAAATIVLMIIFVVGSGKEGFNNKVELGLAAAPKDIAHLMKKVKDSTYEGFNTNTPPDQIAKIVGKMKNTVPIEGFNTNSSPSEIASLIEQMSNARINEGFTNAVANNIAQQGFANPGFGMKAPLVEGYEDVKKEKDEKPAPAASKVSTPKDTLAMPFTLGEIPSQAKNGPHIDAGSTLIKAIQNLNPDQINAMTKDTQQLIETQKSLMGMLGSMKPMLNDGKQLMETFQQMFGQ